jgi:hypothetical protein
VLVLAATSSGQLGELGYHALDPDGEPYCKVLISECFAMDGTAFDGVYGVSSTLSHELLEVPPDPALTEWRQGPNGVWVPVETVDPVENDGYYLDGARVSDFVTPAYYTIGATSGLDRMGLVRDAYSIRPGGYTVTRDAAGTLGRFPAEAARASEGHESGRGQRRLECCQAQ